MPRTTALKNENKRKAESLPPADDYEEEEQEQQAEQAEQAEQEQQEQRSESSEPVPAGEAQDPSPAELAKRAFLQGASQPVSKPMIATGGGGGVNVEAVVLRTSKMNVGPKNAPKLSVTAMATKITGPPSAPTVPITASAAFCLPTKTLEAHPDAIAKDPNAKGETVIDLTTAPKANVLNVFTASFYCDPAGGKKGDRDISSIESITVGSKVLITNVNCTFGKNGETLYTNAKKISLLQPPPEVAALGLLNELRCSSVQQTSALLLSMTLHGFDGFPLDNPAQEAQAAACQKEWQLVVDGVTSKLKSLAAASAGDTQQELQKFVDRAESTTAPNAAAGALQVPVDLNKDCTSPFTAAVVQTGVSPLSAVPDVVLKLFDKEAAKKLPKAFVSAQVVDVSLRGSLVQVSYLLRFIFDKEAALAAIERGEDPVISSKTAAVSVKLSKRTVAPELVGTVVDSKAEAVMKEAIPYSDQAIAASVFPRDATDMLDGHFGNSSGINLSSGIQRVGTLVSKKWLDSNMLGGRGVHIYAPPQDQELIDPSVGVGPSPTLARSGYQALTEGSFELDELKTSDGRDVKFYVVFNGCSEDVKSNVAINNDVEAGEEHLAQLASAKEMDLKDLLKKETVVYAVAV